MISMILNYVRSTQSSVIQIIHRNVYLKCFFQFYQNVCLLLSLHMHSQGSVKAPLRCDGIYNNHIIANFLQRVSVKEFRKSVINWRKYG